MKIQPITPINFGIYKGTKTTRYVQCDYGVFKEKNIEIYFENNIKKIITSGANKRN